MAKPIGGFPPLRKLKKKITKDIEIKEYSSVSNNTIYDIADIGSILGI